MYPIIFQYKILTIAGYGVMLGLAFYLSFMLLERELMVRGKDPELAYKLILVIIPCAIIGAKIFHIIENFKEFLSDPSGTIFSGSGLSVQGGYFLALVVCMWVIKQNNEKVLEIFDIASAPMALGYAIGRIGCHVAGDPCYGIETSSFFGCAYPNGTTPTTSTVIPTQLMESFISFLILLFILELGKRKLANGKIFFIYLMLYGIPRFFIEFIRLNPRIFLNITQAQVVAVFFFLTGLIGYILVDRNEKTATG